ncbi:MAG: cytochrome c [Gammaproteobacteria bacterium]|nr:cytochrome c [Gammaproteobacteria bacterium]
MNTTMKNWIVLLALPLAAMASAGAHAGGDAAAGEQKSAPCATCHGADGNSPNPQFPHLAGQHADYIVKALEDYKNGLRKNPIMSGFAAPLSKQDREDLAAFFASQKGKLTVIESFR